MIFKLALIHPWLGCLLDPRDLELDIFIGYDLHSYVRGLSLVQFNQLRCGRQLKAHLLVMVSLDLMKLPS